MESPLLNSCAISIPDSCSSLRPRCSSPRPWPDLPTDILHQILTRLSPSDSHRLGAACASWRSARSSHSPPWRHPWLLHTTTPYTLTRNFLTPFTTIATSPPRPSPLPALFSHLCLGSAGTHLVMSTGAHFYLYNPFTLSKHTLPLLWDVDHKRTHIAVSDAAVLAVDLTRPQIHYLRRGDHRWFCHEYQGRLIVAAAAASGLDFYALTDIGRLVRIKLVEDMLAFEFMQPANINYADFKEVYLSVSDDGEVLVVMKACPYVEGFPRAFRILKLDQQTWEWEEVESIGDSVLFLGKGRVMKMDAGEMEVSGGRIYTAGVGSFGVWDMSSGTGTVECGCGKPFLAAWVLPPEAAGRRREEGWLGRWVVPVCNVLAPARCAKWVLEVCERRRDDVRVVLVFGLIGVMWAAFVAMVCILMYRTLMEVLKLSSA